MITFDAGPYQVGTKLAVVENTHNFGGGTVQTLESIRRLRRATQGRGVRMHLDGARLWNAHVATGVALAEALAQARTWRKRYGGGMRQAGILAAAGLYALEHNVERLAHDHARARRAGEVISAVAGSAVLDPTSIETNILIANVAAAGWSAPVFFDAAAAEGVRLYAVGPTAIRAVWHLDVDDTATDLAIEVMTGLLTR